jgi:hypothetical protein
LVLTQTIFRFITFDPIGRRDLLGFGLTLPAKLLNLLGLALEPSLDDPRVLKGLNFSKKNSFFCIERIILLVYLSFIKISIF